MLGNVGAQADCVEAAQTLLGDEIGFDFPVDGIKFLLVAVTIWRTGLMLSGYAAHAVQVAVDLANVRNHASDVDDDIHRSNRARLCPVGQAMPQVKSTGRQPDSVKIIRRC